MKQAYIIRSVIYILLQSIVYGFGNPLTKTAYESITPFWCLFFRFFLAFLIFMLFFGKSIIKQLKSAKILDILPASLCMAFAYICCNIALSLTSATNVGFLMSLPIIFAPILSTIILKERYALSHLPLQILVIAGLILLCMQGGSLSFNKGDLFALMTAFFIAGSLVFGKKSLGTHLDPITISATQAGCTALFSLIFALVFDDVSIIAHIKLPAWGVVIYLAIFCTFIAYLLQNFALSWSPPSLVSMVQCSQPVLTAIISFLLLGERLGTLGLIGAFIILACTLAESIKSRNESRD